MHTQTHATRLNSLDGIRGLAILLVVLNHVSVPYITATLPPVVNQTLFGNGIAGVSLLFILSGFLMSTLYPNPVNYLAFWQKRYTRIFPLFLTMCTLMLLFTYVSRFTFLSQLIMLFTVAFGVHFVWVFGVKKYFTKKAKRALFVSFLLLQIFTNIFCVLANSQRVSAFFPGIIGLVNGTLALPFTTTIPILDGVYWSLVAEVTFYLLYPLVCVPLLNFFTRQRLSIQILALLLLFPLFLGLDALTHRFLNFQLYQVALCFYFIPGILLGYFVRTYPLSLEKIHTGLTRTVSFCLFLLFLIVLLIKPFMLTSIPTIYTPGLTLLWALPLTSFFLFALDEKSLFAQFLANKVFVFLGTISYAIYLTHTLLIHSLEKTFPATDLLSNLTTVLITLVFTIVVSVFLYFLLEKPYFTKYRTLLDNSLIDKKMTKKYNSLA